MIVGVTGHRPTKLNFEWDGVGPLSDWLRQRFRDHLTKLKATRLITGMALGADMLFAEVGIEMGLQVLAAIPFRGQEKIWPAVSQERYHRILANPLVTKDIISPGGYSAEKMLSRNMMLVHHCDVLIAVWDGSSGGTAHCYREAQKKGKRIIHIDPRKWRTEL